MHFHQMKDLMRDVDCDQIMHEASYIYIEREDIVAQAVSHFRARQSGAWSSKHEVQRDLSESDYSFSKIRKSYAYLVAERDAWEAWFTERDIVPVFS
jgi:LPS sulfotransferase NodH